MLKREECVGIDVEVKKTEKPRRKKRIRSDIGCSNGENTKRMKKKKKKKKMDSGPDPPPDLPQNFREKIKQLNGCDLNLVIQKRLTKSDVNDKKYRMSIPIRKLKYEFLRGEEKKLLDSREDKKIKVIEVELIEPSCERLTTLSLRKWEMKKKKGKTSEIYNLVNKNWYNRVVVHNGLLEEMVVQLYAFRVEGKLHFALVKVDDVGVGKNTAAIRIQKNNSSDI
ncbi:hypothetical protein Vadar_005866 [Vaccinium darrowii]|uniref:Uncharacterized protein n=1 Tax=Vaccinium darrowii TaxID=229202 RepID=A0ACB7XYC1_9ERIC|nr:hypothetical protein Vadar_005866 [Vaccinium darrowii]